MLERQTRSFDDLLQDNELVSLENKSRNLPRRKSDPTTRSGSPDGSPHKRRRSPSDDVTTAVHRRVIVGGGGTMTRKTRTRRPRIAVIQSGYCAVCNLHYNNVEDHVQSKKHQKLIGEDANYIALNGSLNGFLDSNGIPFLNLNGIEAIGVHDSSLEDFSTPKYRRRNMSRARSVRETSVARDKIKNTDNNDNAGHHLRSRRNVNYMTPPSEEDDFQEESPHHAELLSEPIRRGIKEYRELRSSTRALAKLTEQADLPPGEEVWESGRPKRACLRRKRLSLEERPHSRTFYKVEVVAPKTKTVPKETSKDEKGLIVKFKKTRNTELTRLNNEATNFLFPRREEGDESSDGGGGDNSDDNSEKTDKTDSRDTGAVLSDDSEDGKQRFKYEDEASMDSTCSGGKKRKRRTHAEAFIMDNQKYYKFETPGSRLRYQGSYLPPLVKPPKNGECPTTNLETIKMEEPEEPKKTKKFDDTELDKYGFSFERVPVNAPWYQAFQRLDRGEQRYLELPGTDFNEDIVLPYQMRQRIAPLDPKLCIRAYKQVLRYFRNPPAPAPEPTPETSGRESSSTVFESTLDEDSKMSAGGSSSCSLEDGKKGQGGGKNPRKSPRQHASTLAILSSLIQKRQRRSKRGEGLKSPQLAKIEEESDEDRVDYVEIARTIEEKFEEDDEDDKEDLEEFADAAAAVDENDPVDFHHSKINVAEIMQLFDQEKAKETEKSCRRFFNGSPGRKPGRKRKKNLTGWPNKSKRLTQHQRHAHSDSGHDSDDIDDTTDSLNNKRPTPTTTTTPTINNNNRVKRNKVLTNKVTNEVQQREQSQPVVYVRRLEEKKKAGVGVGGCRLGRPPKRVQMTRRKRVPPVATVQRSPRVLRRPRGRWYRER